jgi:diaminohydroxyphosphoribosylaminopyrimidine deaminase/5-amino-6-(5-phosphoribosylamino)uracil reductase
MSEERFMRRAIELAQKGKGSVSPNPMVGCVIVCDDEIIGEGYHQSCGGPHAEVNAIHSVHDQALLQKSSLYVTLEPCSHHGKTPPCADLIIEKKLRRVVIAVQDPFEQVSGSGIEKLRKAGIEVETKFLETESREMNRRFLTFHEKKRPYVILKWAETSDGFIAQIGGEPQWISNTYSRQLVHKWRSEEDAILIGKNTALLDDPELTTRDWTGKNPIRILLDSQLSVPDGRRIFNQEAKTIILNHKKSAEMRHLSWVKISSVDASEVLKKLHDLEIQSVIVEGGTKVLNNFIQNNCWDEARIFQSDHVFTQGIKAPQLDKMTDEKFFIEKDQLKIIKQKF